MPFVPVHHFTDETLCKHGNIGSPVLVILSGAVWPLFTNDKVEILYEAQQLQESALNSFVPWAGRRHYHNLAVMELIMFAVIKIWQQLELLPADQHGKLRGRDIACGQIAHCGF